MATFRQSKENSNNLNKIVRMRKGKIKSLVKKIYVFRKKSIILKVN
jgi:hypothetical protein